MVVCVCVCVYCSCVVCFVVLDITASIFIHTHTHGPFSGSTQVSRYQKGKTKLDFTETRDSEWQWHQLGRV